MKRIYLAGGCFWGTEHFLKQFDGVKQTTVGFANGTTAHPTYQEVCHNHTGHAECVEVLFDENEIHAEELLRYYFMTIDPLSVNRQGGDVGTQYRTGIYYDDVSLLPAIETVIAEQEQKAGQKLAVEVGPLQNFYEAEEYHQDYLVKNPGGYCHIPVSLMHLKKYGVK